MNGLTPPWFMEAFVDAAGLPLSGGRIYFFVAGSTVMPKTIYSDAEMTIPLSQPLVLDAGGVAPQYFMESGQYKVVVCTPTGDPTSGVIRTRDNVEGSAGGDAGGPFLPLAGQKRVSGWVAFDATVYGVTIDMRVYNLTQLGLELKTGTRIYGGGSLEIVSPVYMDDPRAATLSVDTLGSGPGGVTPINSTHLVGRDPATGLLLPVDLDLPFIPTVQKAAADGVASLGPDGKVPWSQIPSNLRSYTPTTKAIPALTLTSVLPAPIAIPAGFLRQGSQLNSRFLVDAGAPGISNSYQWFIDGVSQSGGTYNTNQASDLRMQVTRREGSEFLSRAEFRYSNGYNFSSSLVDLDPDVEHTIDIRLMANSGVTVTVQEYEVTISDAPIPGVVPGTLDDSAAPAGCVGELLSSIIPIGSKVAIYSCTGKTIATLPLTEGEWDVWGILLRDDGNPDSATYASASLSFANNAEDATFRASKTNDAYSWRDLAPPHLPIRVPKGSTYPVYLVAKSTFSGVAQAYVYGNLYARRVR